MKDLVCEYLAVIDINKLVTRDTMEMKIRCKNEYGLDSAVSSKPHFTVFNVVQSQLYEGRLTKCLERIVPNISPFKIDLQGFDCFKNSTCTLYIKVKDEMPFSNMVHYLKKSLSPVLKSKKNIPPIYTTKPHLTIAKGILEDEFLKIWPNWEGIEYQSSTDADRLVLLKRGNNWKFDIIGEYPFLGNGPLNPQMTLF